MNWEKGRVKRPVASMCCLILGFTTISILCAKEPKFQYSIQGKHESVSSLAWSRDSKTLASASGSFNNDDAVIRLWDVETGKSIANFKGHTKWVAVISFSPDGKTLASGSGDNSIKLWDIATGKNTATLISHTEEVYSLIFSPDGQSLFSGGADHKIKVWNVATGKNTLTLSDHKGAIQCMAISKDGKRLVSGSRDTTIKMWNLETGTPTTFFKGGTDSDEIMSVAFSPDDKTLASVSDDSPEIKLWDLVVGKYKTLLQKRADITENNETLTLSFSPDGKTLISGDLHGNVKLWDLATCKTNSILKGHKGAVLCLAVSSDGKCFASGGVGDCIKVWKLVSPNDHEREPEK